MVLVNPDVGSVHYLHYFSVYTPGGDTLLPPQLLALERRPPQEQQLAFLLAELAQQGLANINRQLFVAAVANFDTQVKGYLQ